MELVEKKGNPRLTEILIDLVHDLKSRGLSQRETLEYISRPEVVLMVNNQAKLKKVGE